MALYEIAGDGLVRHAPVDFAALEIRERRDLQRLLRDDITVIDADLLVVAEEFGEWEDARRRIDLLALDRDGRLTVIELKRTTESGHADLQALRYAAMVSAMTFEQVAANYAVHLGRHQPDSGLDARSALLQFLDADADVDPDELISSDVRVILAGVGFGREITTTVLWLNGFEGMDIRCIRLVPYELGGRVLIDVQQVIPLPEAADYQVRLRRKDTDLQRARRAQARDFTRYQIVVDGVTMPDENKRNAVRVMVEQLTAKGADPNHMVSILGKAKFLVLDGEHTDVDSVEQALLATYPAGRPQRYFIDHAIVRPGRTYILSKMWGSKTEPTLAALVARFPDLGVTFHRATS